MIFEPPGQRGRIISLLKSQIEAQLAAADEIRSTNIESATIIANEFTQGTTDLRSSLYNLSASLDDSIQEATDVLGDELNLIGNRLGVCVLLISWIAVQQAFGLGAILKLLRGSRSNEAAQLVKQGLRHLAVGEYSEAEERFLLALSFDSTDYQTLLNLAFVKAQLGDSSAANTYFRKSVTLPANLDAASKARALWAWARLNYADGHYERALDTASKAMSLQGRPDGNSLFTVGVYAARKGDVSLSLKSLSAAIEADATFFARAGSEPDLLEIRPQVSQMLGSIASRAQVEAETSWSQANEYFARLRVDCTYVWQHDQALIQKFAEFIQEGGECLASPSYTMCLAIRKKMCAVNELLHHLPELNALHSEHEVLMETYLATAASHPQRRVAPQENLGFWALLIRRLNQEEYPFEAEARRLHGEMDRWVKNCERERVRAHEIVEFLNTKRDVIRFKISEIENSPASFQRRNASQAR